MARKVHPIATPEAQETLSSELLGLYVRARRTQLGLRIDDAAAFCGVAKETLMRVEHGHPTVQLNSMLQICQGLGIQLLVRSWENEDEKDVWV